MDLISFSFFRWKVVDYYMIRAKGSLKILDRLDLIGRTSELAKLFGIQFLEVLTRGSQFRVESIMLRLVRAKNMVAVSPTIKVKSFGNPTVSSRSNCCFSAKSQATSARIYSSSHGARIKALH